MDRVHQSNLRWPHKFTPFHQILAPITMHIFNPGSIPVFMLSLRHYPSHQRTEETDVVFYTIVIAAKPANALAVPIIRRTLRLPNMFVRP